MAKIEEVGEAFGGSRMRFTFLKNRLKERHYRIYIALRDLRNLVFAHRWLFERKRGAWEFYKSSISLLLRRPYVWGMPVVYTIEPINICNLKCPVCESGSGILRRPPDSMSFELFKKIMDEIAPYCNTLLYYFMGEPFLNKEWVKEVRYAKDLGVPFVTTCTNGDFAVAEDILASKIDWVSFQLGGMTQETHSIYRKGSNLERVLANLEAIVNLKRKEGADWLKIEAGFIVMKHNEHEIGQFIEYCRKIGVDSYNIISPTVRTLEQAKKFLPSNYDYWIFDPCSYQKGILKRKIVPKNDCPWIYYSVVIMVNGDVVPCCHDPNGMFVMGNVFESPLKKIWNNPRFLRFRKGILNEQRKIKICSLCSSYGIPNLQ